MLKTYLAGPMAGLTVAASNGWREAAIAALALRGIAGFSPTRHLGSFAKDHVFDMVHRYEHNMATDTAVLFQDHWDVQTADAVLVNLLGAERVSQGTVMEIAFAHAYRKPLVIAMEDEGNVHDHPMIRAAANYRVQTLDEAIAIIASLLKPTTARQGSL